MVLCLKFQVQGYYNINFEKLFVIVQNDNPCKGMFHTLVLSPPKFSLKSKGTEAKKRIEAEF
jgi:hypothetical protein